MSPIYPSDEPFEYTLKDRALSRMALGASFRAAGTNFDGGEGIRTPDPMVANHVLCQLSYTP